MAMEKGQLLDQFGREIVRNRPARFGFVPAEPKREEPAGPPADAIAGVEVHVDEEVSEL